MITKFCKWAFCLQIFFPNGKASDIDGVTEGTA